VFIAGKRCSEEFKIEAVNLINELIEPFRILHLNGLMFLSIYMMSILLNIFDNYKVVCDGCSFKVT
jgi:hypothetical protein